MDSSQSARIQPSDLVVFVPDEDGMGPTTQFCVGILGDKVKGLFTQAHEALFRKDFDWQNKYEQTSAEFEKIAGFKIKAVYQADAELRLSKGLKPLIDNYRKPLLEELNISSKLRTKEG